MSDAMMRNLLRKRLKEGADSATIRNELLALGLTSDQIRDLAQEVGSADRGASTAEVIWQWLPLLMMLPGSAALGTLYLSMPRPEFAITCFGIGAVMSSLSSLAIRVGAKMNQQRGEINFFGAIGAVFADPGKYWKLLVPLVSGWVLMIAGVAIDPMAIQHLNRSRGSNSSSWEE